MNHLFQRYERASTPTISEFVVYEKGLERILPTNEIEYLISDSEYVAIHTKSRKFLKRLALEMLSRQLPKTFMRIHRSIIINRQHIKGWNYLNNGTYSFHFQNEVLLKSSLSYQEAIRDRLSSKH